MSSIVVQAFVTLDGVSQAPGGSDEDLDGGFPYGGWQMDFDRAASERADAAEENPVAEWEERTEALLLGRTTYELFASSWGVWDESAPGFQGELTRRYNRIPKYVASHTLTELPWKNSRLLRPDVPTAVAELREQPGGEIRVWGSTQLIRTLAEHDLVDEYRLMVYPLVLGTGKRLFSDGFPVSRLALAESRALPSGVLVNVYRRAVEA
ncbi:deaminase reductase [Sinomonas cellulolyticus]|uniref:Dihydrofolate reductase family protein n=1 Tax=Sinomonas cellulolyticus TaxID=2801916 RepID=A0ABS1JY17_9MICC|nr:MULTISPECIES: dihydrofolate reductase family protein [Sinomonas]MBL0704083.1 dihydrofolate reductase family protein [Sinomonas cellulolyticus]GHG56958.1 deaminase reductase [Sinomonas sp. KCTC 49339]